MVEKKKRRGPRGQKKGFVEALPHDMPAAEVVAKGKAEGVALTTHQVNNIRWTIRQREKNAKPSIAKPTNGPRVRTRVTPSVVLNNAGRLAMANNAGRIGSEQARSRAFRHMALQIGLLQARAILDEFESSLELGARE